MISSPVDRAAKRSLEASASRLKRAHSLMSVFFASGAIQTIFRIDLPPSLHVGEVAVPKTADGVSLQIEMTWGKSKERRGRDFPARNCAFV
jgi:hypothetical protein